MSSDNAQKPTDLSNRKKRSTKRRDYKDEKKEEVPEEIKEEVKEQTKEEVKEKTKEEVKADLQEEQEKEKANEKGTQSAKRTCSCSEKRRSSKAGAGEAKEGEGQTEHSEESSSKSPSRDEESQPPKANKTSKTKCVPPFKKTNKEESRDRKVKDQQNSKTNKNAADDGKDDNKQKPKDAADKKKKKHTKEGSNGNPRTKDTDSDMHVLGPTQSKLSNAETSFEEQGSEPSPKAKKQEKNLPRTSTPKKAKKGSEGNQPPSNRNKMGSTQDGESPAGTSCSKCPTIRPMTAQEQSKLTFNSDVSVVKIEVASQDGITEYSKKDKNTLVDKSDVQPTQLTRVSETRPGSKKVKKKSRRPIRIYSKAIPTHREVDKLSQVSKLK